MKKSNIKTVFFDWDYTLAYTETPQNTMSERYAHMFRAADLPYEEAAIAEALEKYREDVAAGRVEHVPNPQTRREIARMYSSLLDHLGHDDRSWSLLMRLYGTYAQLPTHLYDESRRTLQRIAAAGYKIGIISNHSTTARPMMEKLIGDLVESQHIVISEEEGVHKPAKTIFKRAAARLRTAPEQCLYVGDNLQVDAIGAVRVGGFACGVWIDRREADGERHLPDRVARVHSLPELAAKLV